MGGADFVEEGEGVRIGWGYYGCTEYCAVF